MSTLGVVVATFGSESWKEAGAQKANLIKWFWSDPSLVVHYHGEDLADARNTGIEMLEADYVTICDADDFLLEGYEAAFFDKMKVGDFIYQPATRGIYPDGSMDEESYLIPVVDINRSNFLVIGTVFPKRLAVKFDPALPALEDWDFFSRIIANGAKVITCDSMVYGVGVGRDNSRNQNTNAHAAAYRAIISKPHMGKLKEYMEEV